MDGLVSTLGCKFDACGYGVLAGGSRRMNIFGYYFDLTFGPIATAVLLPVLAWYIKSLLNKADKLQDERHLTLVNKLTSFCEKNQRDHDELWKRVDYHKHDEEGNVVIK